VSVEETSALMSDLSFSSVMVIALVIAVIVLYYRWWRSVPILVVPLLLATVYAFAVASMWPFQITELNSNTAFLGSIIVGNGINFGILLLARYVEERRRGMPTREALVVAVGRRGWGHLRRRSLQASLMARSSSRSSVAFGSSDTSAARAWWHPG